MTGDRHQPQRADGQPDRRYRAYIDEQKQQHEDRVLEPLDAEGRIIRAARMLPMSGTLTEEQIAGVRENASPTSPTTISRTSRSAGIGLKSPSPVSEFQQQVQGRHLLAREINAWVEQHASQTRPPLASSRPASSASTITRHHRPSSVSKTTVCLEACTTEIVGSVHVPCNMTCTSVSAFSALWCECLGLPTGRTAAQRFSRIVEKPKTRTAATIDDAHKLLASRSRTLRTNAPTANPWIFDVHEAAL